MQRFWGRMPLLSPSPTSAKTSTGLGLCLSSTTNRLAREGTSLSDVSTYTCRLVKLSQLQWMQTTVPQRAALYFVTKSDWCCYCFSASTTLAASLLMHPVRTQSVLQHLTVDSLWHSSHLPVLPQVLESPVIFFLTFSRPGKTLKRNKVLE